MIEKAQEWIGNGRTVALATVIATWGSSPRPVGSQMVIDEEGRFEGSVSGGCIEGAVIEEALEAIRGGKPRRVFFGVTQDQAWEVGLACGGEIEIFVEKVTWQSVLNELVGFRAVKRPACLITDLDSGEKTLIPLDDPGRLEPLSGELRAQVEHIRDGERNTIAAAGDRTLFLHCFQPPAQLIIVGAVHIAKALAPIARIAGYEVIIVDPREAFANTVRFGDVPVVVEWPDEAMERIGLHSRTAVVTLAHDPKIDDPALSSALRSDAFYIGALGGSKSHANRLVRLGQAGFTDDQLRRIHGPVGLNIGAVTAEEIAVAIMAQVTDVRRNAGGGKKNFPDAKHSGIGSACFK